MEDVYSMERHKLRMRECIAFLAILATEMPPCRASGHTQLRREFVHKLSVSPCTHSELSGCCGMTQWEDTEELHVRDPVLADLTRGGNESGDMNPGKFTLRDDLCRVLPMLVEILGRDDGATFEISPL